MSTPQEETAALFRRAELAPSRWWMRSIILTPPRIRLLLLSATVGNADEFAAWIAEVRGVHCGVITRPGARPVPLRAAMLLPDKRLIPLVNDAGKLNPEIARLLEETAKAPRSPRSGERGRSGRDFHHDLLVFVVLLFQLVSLLSRLGDLGASILQLSDARISRPRRLR